MCVCVCLSLSLLIKQLSHSSRASLPWPSSHHQLPTSKMFNSPPPLTYDDLPDPDVDEVVALSPPVRRRVAAAVTPPLPFGMFLSSTKKKKTSAVATAAASKPLLGTPNDHRRLSSSSSLYSPSKFFSALNKSVEHELDGMESEDDDPEDEYGSYRNTFRVSDDVKVSGKENMTMSAVQPKIDFWNRRDGTTTMMTPTNPFKKTPKSTATSPAKVTPLGRIDNNTTPMSKNSGYDGDDDDEEGYYRSRKKNGPSPSSTSMMGLKSFDSLAVQRRGSSFGPSPVSMKGHPPLKEVTIVSGFYGMK